MRQPFEDPDADYRVLVNARNQHCLWPSFAGIPAGWTSVFGPAVREAALDYVRAHWTDMRPQDADAHHTAGTIA